MRARACDLKLLLLMTARWFELSRSATGTERRAHAPRVSCNWKRPKLCGEIGNLAASRDERSIVLDTVLSRARSLSTTEKTTRRKQATPQLEPLSSPKGETLIGNSGFVEGAAVPVMYIVANREINFSFEFDQFLFVQSSNYQFLTFFTFYQFCSHWFNVFLLNINKCTIFAHLNDSSLFRMLFLFNINNIQYL